ncbi:MAG: DoxX family protein [Saprospiraceae bacterium]|nr:DoxX family protein [Saprospiraceae bacterium]
MTLSTLIIRIAIAAIILTLVVGFWKKGQKSWLMTFAQNFCGVLFLFSGWVKAVDPLGTAYKMEQYFDEFYSTFEATWFGFLAPIFPVLSEYAIWFSLFMIIFEIMLGLMLVLGTKTKFTSWAFLLLVAFFTVLTGFTYLTGHVPSGVNFFNFAEWGSYNANNMKVTDCGCFGDFIKLEPKTSFFKDVFLLIPSLFFVFRHKDMHQLFSKKTNSTILWLALVALVYYCFANFKWDIPHADFRPFKEGTDIRAQFEAERDAMAAVKITDWELKHNETGERLIVANDEYLGNYKDYKGVYSVVEQIKGKPAIPITKISDFEITDIDGNDITEDILGKTAPHFLIVNYKLYGDPKAKKEIVRDSLFMLDTMVVFNADSGIEDTVVMEKFDRIVENEETVIERNWKQGYIDTHVNKLKPFTDAAMEEGFQVLMAVGGSDKEAIADFNNTTGLNLDYGMADDILLKTIVRSNPGIVLMQDGKILNKWHIRKLPDYEKVADKYLR